MSKQVYDFSEGNASMREMLGGKGANLAEMKRLGLPVPDGFTITTEACMTFLGNGEVIDEVLRKEIMTHINRLEETVGKWLSSSEHLLLLSVRSGSPYSMPGMMDTILNLGLNDVNVEIFAERTNDPRFAYDCYRRLLQMYGNVVYGIDSAHFERFLDYYKQKVAVASDKDFSVEHLQEIVRQFQTIYLEVAGKAFPQDPKEQLFEAIKAVFRSWNNERAQVYRRLHHISDSLGTAVNIQEMVFGNNGDDSGTGVVFTRNPSTGKKELFGEYLMNAQGEDVVAGIRTPLPIRSLKEKIPNVYKELVQLAQQLEAHYRDMQDIEFTVENGQLYLLQTRNGKRTTQAAFKIAVDLVGEGVKTEEESLLSLDPESIHQLLHPVFAEQAIEEAELITSFGLPASPGAATGKICFEATTAKNLAENGEKVILIRQETSPEDIEGMVVSEAIVTSRGGMTSHAAVVARGMGTCCVAGCSELEVNERTRQVIYPGGVLNEGDVISVDGNKGAIYLGEVAITAAETNEDFLQVLSWARKYARMDVRMNAETPQDIRIGLGFHAAGIGLVRTEHMFFSPERLIAMRRFILSENQRVRQSALSEVLDYQIQDFINIFRLMGEKGTVIRLLDPPFHEFVPTKEWEMAELGESLGVSVTAIKQRIQELSEINPMLGHRGCRLAITYPELYLMQAEAIIRGAIYLWKQEEIRVYPEMMIPLVGMKQELEQLRKKIVAHIDMILLQEDVEIEYQIGTMIELPRACFVADELAEQADFFSFGTNDLTQMTYGFSRDDAAKYINHYMEQHILPQDPFQTLDVAGVGELMKIAVEKGRRTKKTLKIGVCGELGGDPVSIQYFESIGLDYVSCSPYRVPVAQLAAAQSTLRRQMDAYDKNK